MKKVIIIIFLFPTSGFGMFSCIKTKLNRVRLLRIVSKKRVYRFYRTTRQHGYKKVDSFADAYALLQERDKDLYKRMQDLESADISLDEKKEKLYELRIQKDKIERKLKELSEIENEREV